MSETKVNVNSETGGITLETGQSLTKHEQVVAFINQEVKDRPEATLIDFSRYLFVSAPHGEGTIIHGVPKNPQTC